MTFYIEGLSKNIQTIVAHHRETVPAREMNVYYIAYFARSIRMLIPTMGLHNSPMLNKMKVFSISTTEGSASAHPRKSVLITENTCGMGLPTLIINYLP